MWYERNCRLILERIILLWLGYCMIFVILMREYFILINYVNINGFKFGGWLI